MRRIIAVLGVAGLGLMGAPVSANAAPGETPPGPIVCHATGSGTYEAVAISVHGMIHDLNGHLHHPGDIIPFERSPGDGIPGQNMTPENIALLENGCVAVAVDPVDPPADPVVVPPADPAVVPPVATAVTPVVAVPKGAARNLGYNVDTAVNGKTGEGIPAWLAALTGLFAAVAGLVAWRGRVRARNANS